MAGEGAQLLPPGLGRVSQDGRGGLNRRLPPREYLGCGDQKICLWSPRAVLDPATVWLPEIKLVF